MTIKISGLDRLYRKLDKVKATETLVPPTERGVLRLQRRMQEYPAPPPSSTYRRTGTLGRRWTTRVRKSANGVIGKVGNATRYAPWVQSHRFQAAIHHGRWPTDQRVIDQERPAIVSDYKRAIDKALEG